MVNELGMNLHDLQVAGDWASFESVKSYARANIAKKRELLDRKVVPIFAGHLLGTLRPHHLFHAVPWGPRQVRRGVVYEYSTRL